MFYLVIAYDTPSDKRRNKIVKVLKRFGERRQYSLFEARVNRDQLATLKRDLAKHADEAEDTLAIYFPNAGELGAHYPHRAQRFESL